MNQGYTAYKTAGVDTADRGRLILIAYDVALKHCKLSLENFGSHTTIEARTKHLFKAQDAIGELMGSLKLDVGDIAKNLYRLYEYMLHTLVEDNVKSNPEKVSEVVGHLQVLRDAWSEAIAKVKMEAAQTQKTP
ncbi:MAG: flagellar export chaperone FliS, partial [Chitinivibrionales bacterium]|nr:flagellar export chaperone FliS [Chitinivibrionales bacterium]